MTGDKDDRTYIRLHDGMPDHPKIEGLSDAAFRLLITLWCRASEYRTDGWITASWWAKQKKLARQQLIDARLVDVSNDGDVYAHDYTEHQRTAAEIDQYKAAKSRGGVKGNHTRWHVNTGRPDPTCPVCTADNVSHMRTRP